MKANVSSVFILSVALTSCGFNDPGTGNNTLLLQAVSTFQASNNQTDVAIVVTRNGAAVDDARIAWTHFKDDAVVVTETPETDGEYAFTFDGYWRRIEIEVVAGNDFLSAQVEGPTPHTIRLPKNNEVLERDAIGNNLKVSWAAEGGVQADHVEVRLDGTNFRRTNPQDDGRIDVAFSALQDGPNDVKVIRSRTLEPEGGAAGSIIELRYEVENQFVVNP